MPDEAKMILVVEDEPMIRMDIVAALEAAGFDVLEAGNVSEALSVLAMHRKIMAVFTDIDMPGELNGLDLAAAVRSQDGAMAILVTSGRCHVHADDLPDKGRFFAKPYFPAEIVRSLGAMLAA